MDRLRLNPVSQRHVTAGSCAGVWLIGCEPVDGTVRYCRECGGMGRVRSSWRRRFVHMPVGQHAVHLLVRVRRYECMACARSWTDDLTHMADEGRRLTDAAVWWAVAECFASIFLKQFLHYFSAVWAAGFQQELHHMTAQTRTGTGPPCLYIPET